MSERALICLFYSKRWHIAEYNLFWANIRENAAQGIEAFANKK
jgi:hypothetical protein